MNATASPRLPLQPLVRDPQRIRLAMLGKVDGNGHPFSWSAILNGRYDADAMADCGYPVIPQYLSLVPAGELGIAGCEVTHVWCDDPADARRVARAALIETVVDRPEDVIGAVDAVVIPTDIGAEHVRRARPFIEAGVPVLIDKPLADNVADLRQFQAWQGSGAAFCSSSCMRYAREFTGLRAELETLGSLRVIFGTMMKRWDRYGIHILEAVYPLLRPGGWEWIASTGGARAEVVHIHHADGVDVVLCVHEDMVGGFGHVHVHGIRAARTAVFQDTYYAFRAQLAAFVDYLRTGRPPIPFEETVELMQLLIAAARSRDDGGRRVFVSEVV